MPARCPHPLMSAGDAMARARAGARHPPWQRSTAPGLLPALLTLTLALAHLPLARAMHVPSSLEARADKTSPTSIWVPIVVVILVLAVGCILVYVYRASRAAPSSTPATREVTAAQLAGVNPTGSAAPRRPRRTRRTPSQISTRSLPEYNKEAGAQELVIHQEQEGEAEMQPVPEGDDSSRDSAENGRSDDDHGTPLLAGTPEPMAPPRRSAALEHMRDARGPAPEYTEITLNDEPEDDVPEAEEEAEAPAGRRGLRAFFSRAPPAPVLPGPGALGHARNGSAVSFASSRSGAASPPPRRGAHRSSMSGSAFLTRMRSSGSLGSLTSPSLLSVASISAPLRHTTTRAEFAYPAGGPTPEQVRLISSRESLGRFGVPYGPAALAFASASRVSVGGPPPPGFEERLEGHVRSGSALSGNARPGSALSGHARSGSDDAEAAQPVSGGARPSIDAAPRPSVDGVPRPSADAAPRPSVDAAPRPSADGLPPPSAFRPAPVPEPAQRESVASTSASFATAHETLASPTPADDDDEPGTPTRRMHVLEPTDATVMPGRA